MGISLSMTAFKNQNLQGRSFQQQILNDADFSGADIRGCNFNKAQLAGANFERVKAGLLPQKLMLLSSMTIAIALLVGDALSRLIFGALGQIPNSSAWSFVLILYGVLSLAGASAGISSLNSISLKASRFAGTFSAVLSGALLGFFYAGSASKNNPSLAIAGAISASLVMLAASVFFQQALIRIAIATIATVTTYGAAFLLGATASVSFSADQVAIGITCAIATLVYILLTLNLLKSILRSLKLAATTSFKGANLTNARFDQANLNHTDFSQTIGYC